MKSPNPRIAAMELGIQLGEDVQRLFPYIAKKYTEGICVQELVQNYWNKIQRHKIFQEVSREIMQTAFLYALKGYHGILQAKRFNVRKYPGLLSKKTFEKHRQEHWESGRVKRIVREFGYTPYDKNEKTRIITLAHNKDYQKMHGKNTCIDNTLIAMKINEDIHHGKPIRSNTAIAMLLCKHRKHLVAS